MSEDAKERTVTQQEDPKLFEHLQSLMFSSATDIELESTLYRIARDQDKAGNECFVLSPGEARK